MQSHKITHQWQISVQEATVIQRELAQLVEIKPLAKPIRTIAGLDAAFSACKKYCIAGVVIWDVLEECVVEAHTVKVLIQFPYRTGYLSFREAPGLLEALGKVKSSIDLLMCDGQGIAHPRRMGIASHMGLLTDLPSMGCAKSRLYGEHDEVGVKKGARVPLMRKNERIGTVVRSKDKVRPLYISVGHKIDLLSAEMIVMKLCKNYRLPEPTRLADKLVAKAKREGLV